MDGGLFKSFSFAFFCGVFAFNAAVGTSLFSDYGQIQNVQNYSSNPFWSPGSPYNQKTPQPIYVQGTDLKSGECVNILEPLISMECIARDNCKNTSLSDIRPSVMVQLSNLPNKNYVSACAGYIDSVFESYVAQYGNSVANGEYTAFPTATAPANYAENNTIQINNPYKVEPAKWQQDVKERKDKLQKLQEKNGLGKERLTATKFPSVYEDLSFAARVELQKEGYEPFKDMESYIIPDFQDAGEWCMGEGKYSDFCFCRGPEKDSDYCKGLFGKNGKKGNPDKGNPDDNKPKQDDAQTPPPPQQQATPPQDEHPVEHHEEQQEEQPEERQEERPEEQNHDEEEDIEIVYEVHVLSGNPDNAEEAEDLCYTNCHRSTSIPHDFMNTNMQFNPNDDTSWYFCVDLNENFETKRLWVYQNTLLDEIRQEETITDVYSPAFSSKNYANTEDGAKFEFNAAEAAAINAAQRGTVSKYADHKCKKISMQYIKYKKYADGTKTEVDRYTETTP